ncbi:hypothetical protein [Bordetella genomosp. 11]|nr:hypothetical protein [Bordetella genomosp. 11]
MQRLLSVCLIATAAMAVAACQPLSAGRAEPAAMPPDPQGAVGAATKPGVPTALQAGPPTVEFRLAQTEAAPGLHALQLGERQLWMLQQPVLTRTDIVSVTPVRSRAGASYVRFQFAPAAAPRLAAIAQRYPGKFLLLSIDGELAAAPTLGGPMNDGVLFVPVVSDRQAAQVSAAVAGAPMPAGR